jgi:L-Ala-D/L-Glu epimerase
VRIVAVRYHRYRVPFRRPFTTARGVERARQGLLLRLETDAGTHGFGEAAPLPSFGAGTADDAENCLRRLIPSLSGLALADLPALLDTIPLDVPGAAALRFGLDTAALDAEARTRRVPLAALLCLEHALAVPVNATVSYTATEDAVAAARVAVRQGFSTIKLKVGISGDDEAEIERVAVVREAIGPAVALRLDANGGWTPERAVRLLRRFERYDIDYVEQPVAAEDIAGLAEIRRAVDVPVAADEAATTPAAVEEIVERRAAGVIIVKPALVGGLRPARELIRRANAAGIVAVVTTTLETGIATAAALHLAATLSRPIPACGLATTGLLESDLLWEPLEFGEGIMRLPACAGLGVGVGPGIRWR